MIPLLLQPDSAFGWTGISTGFPNSWRWTAAEVAEVIEKRIERSRFLKSIIRHNRKKKAPK